MDELGIVKSLYGNYRRPVMILSRTGEFLWCNPKGCAVNMMSLAGDIAKNIGTSDRFLLQSAMLNGSCELHYCEDIGEGIYIAEVLDDKMSAALRNGSDSEYLDSVIRNGVSMISSSLQLIYDELGDKLDADSVMYLNNGMLGCYDMLRGASMCRDAKCTITHHNDEIVDFSCLVGDFYDELNALSKRIPIDFDAQIESGIFVQCSYELLYNALVWFVMDVCRKNTISDLTIRLEKQGANAVFSVQAHDNGRIFDETVLRMYRDVADNAARTRRCVDNLIGIAGAAKCGDNSFSLPMCSITAIPLKSPQVRYKSDRFSKSRVVLSDIYKIDYFDSKE
ncbi:MAG: hypothetical protein IJO29_02030 [Oscillospiraceae bacterium]|nr:hypothetical protein [Oscillospiraceae bacterium]